VPLGASDDEVSAAERLQTTLGEGPCLSAIAAGQPLIADLAAVAERWPMFHREFTAQTRFRSVASLPLRLPGQRPFGALDLYSTSAEVDPFLINPQVQVEITDQISAFLLDIPGTVSPRAGQPAVEQFANPLAADRMTVWAAVGMVMAAVAGIDESQALALLRAYAFGRGATLEEVAQLITGKQVDPAEIVTGDPAPLKTGAADGPANHEQRLGALLDAIRSMAGELTVLGRLRRTVELAPALVGARYAAMEVRHVDGTVNQILYSSSRPDDLHLIRQALALQGVTLPELPTPTPRPATAAHPPPARRSDSTAAKRGGGSGPAVLTVEVKSVFGAYGYLHLIDRSAAGQFSTAEEQLITELAQTTAVGVDNALVYEESRQHPDWLIASAKISQSLLRSFNEDEEQVWQLIADTVHTLAGARTVTICTPSEDDPAELLVRVAAGVGADRLRGTSHTCEGSLDGQALTHQSLQIWTPGTWRICHADVEQPTPLGAALALPLTAEGRARGVILISRHLDQPLFSAGDIKMAEDFATHAALALELAETRAAQQRLEARDNLERVASSWQDGVIQRLFTIALTLEAATAADHPAPLLAEAIDAISDTIHEARTSLRSSLRTPHP
jgi:GAF domain-containing protein